ncbi:MAG: FAD-binding protein [Coriobacteriales bacterium]|nr:FAD-binding protein [Coriobacteriales bacterium]
MNQMTTSRRSFVKGSAALAAGAAAGALVAPAMADEAQVTLNAQNVNLVKWDFEIPPAPITDDMIKETVPCEIVIVGAGFSGIVTALAAAEEGAKVTVVTASDDIVIRGGSMNARWSKAMEELTVGMKVADDRQFIREQLACAGYNVDQKKWWKFVKYSPEAMNWLIDKMEAEGFMTVLERGFDMGGDTFFSSLPGSHSWTTDDSGKAGKGSQMNVVETVYRDALAAGVEFVFSCPARQLVRDDNNTGRVSAVIAQNADGDYIKYEASKAIVLATGDFSANHDMMAKYCPEFLPLIDPPMDEPDYNVGFKFGGLMPGDGHKMGLWIGAAWQKTYPCAPMTFAIGTAGPFNQPYSGHRGLLLNKYGERYGNEDICGVFAGVAQVHQPEMKVYAIWGANYAEGAAPWITQGSKIEDAPATPEFMLENWKEGFMIPDPQDVIMSDDLEDLVAQLGLPVEETMATIARYNELCEKGVDEDFCKCAEQMVPIAEPPYFGVLGNPPHFLTVCGGLRTDDKMRVCDADDNPIPGLYNVGTMIGDYFANIYNFMIEGNNLGANCLTFGYLTGRGLAQGTI